MDYALGSLHRVGIISATKVRHLIKFRHHLPACTRPLARIRWRRRGGNAPEALLGVEPPEEQEDMAVSAATGY